MSFFSPTPEERAEKNKQIVEKAKRRAREEQRRIDQLFTASPVGRARSARIEGRKIFQIDVPLSQTTARTVAMEGAYANSTETEDYSMVIQSIEEEGWHLEHVGYVYRLTGSESRDKFLASGQQEAISGEIVGIYIFRAREAT